jgi:hypothetical protein
LYKLVHYFLFFIDLLFFHFHFLFLRTNIHFFPELLLILEHFSIFQKLIFNGLLFPFHTLIIYARHF